MMFLLVHSKSKAEADRLAHARVLELFAPRVEIPALRAGRRAVVQRLLLDAPVANGREIIADRPDARGIFLMEIDRAGLERLEGDLPLAVIFEAQAVEIVDADIDRQILAPNSPSTRSNSMKRPCSNVFTL